jgi:acetylcholinesterase
VLTSSDDNNEGSIFAPNAATAADVANFFSANYPKLNSTITAEINAEYPLMPALPEHAAFFPSASAAYGESTFTCPGNFISGTLAAYSSSVWNYHYNVTSVENVAAGLGTTHTFELPAILGPGNAGDSPTDSYSSYNSEIVSVVMDYWMSFVRDLDPNTFKDPNSPVWESFGSKGRRLLLQTNATIMENVPQDQVDRCSFWKGLAVIMEQ